MGGFGTAVAVVRVRDAVGGTDAPEIVRTVRSDVGGGNYGPEDGRGCGGSRGGGVRDDKTTTTTTTTTKRPMMVPDVAARAREGKKTIADMVVARENSWHVEQCAEADGVLVLVFERG